MNVGAGHVTRACALKLLRSGPHMVCPHAKKRRSENLIQLKYRTQ